MALKEVTALLLIHFDKHNNFSMDKDLDNMRFSKLKEIIFEHPVRDMIIVSNLFIVQQLRHTAQLLRLGVHARTSGFFLLVLGESRFVRYARNEHHCLLSLQNSVYKWERERLDSGSLRNSFQNSNTG